MTFERHAFISYAHIDNEPLTPEQKGWVTRFHATLTTMLSQRLGQRADIWRDDKLAGNDIFAEEIIDQFARTALLITVLTPRYLNSEWCTREIEAFCAAAQQTGGLLVDNKSRVFKVIKTPVTSEERLPPVIGQMLGYEFYDLDDERTPRDLDPDFGDPSRQEFLRKLNKLAWDIAQLWSTLSTRGSSPVTDPERPTIYLAEVSRDQRAAREMMETSLKQHGYRVLPERALPLDEAVLLAEVDQCLADSIYAIHLIGSGYGFVPDGPSHRSMVVLQNERGAVQSRQRGLPRLIWLPVGTAGEQAAQQAFIDALQIDAQLQFGADLLTGDLESVKAAVHATLARIERERIAPQPASDPGQPAGAAAQSEAPTVYLLCDERDRPDIVALIRLLRAAGLQVTTPVFSGDAETVREANQQRLASCDAVLLFYGAGDEAWKFHQDNALRRSAALRTRADGQVPGRAPPVSLFVAAPLTADKALLIALAEPGMIDGSAGCDEGLLRSFIKSLSSPAAAAGPSR